MKIISKTTEMTAAAEAARNAGTRIGLVPTMGYLHEGHLSLIRLAREKCDLMVTSIFVNPTQFAEGEDLETYPRNLKRDVRLAEEAGTDIIFAPPVSEMYPERYLTYVRVGEITQKLCGKSRPAHFQGVTTVVAKLFNIVKPHIAVFGQKDAQQAIVIKKMVRDLNFDLEILVGPIVREKDGLALSSRNVYLSAQERQDALVLSRALGETERLIKSGVDDPVAVKEKIKEILLSVDSSAIDYIAVVDGRTLDDLTRITGTVLIALAVRFGRTRLIDNILIETGTKSGDGA